MNIGMMLGITAGVVAISCVGVIIYLVFYPQPPATKVKPNRGEKGHQSRTHDRQQPKGPEQAARAREAARNRRARARAARPPLGELLFRAGYFNARDVRVFERRQKIFAIVGGALGAMLGSGLGDPLLIIPVAALGAGLGFRFPLMALERRIKRRHQEIMYFLPLVIEQLAIGVSSSLDIGPCISRVIEMADERRSHNVVTEYLQFVVSLVRSGSALEEALREVGERVHHSELNHTFLALGQVARYGGEITKQLQELSDSMSTHREVYVEGLIKTLELKATGPVVTAFVGFMTLLFAALYAQFLRAFSS